MNITTTTFAAAVAGWLISLTPLAACASDDHAHAAPAPPAAGAAAPARFALVSDTLELVGVLAGRQLTLYLDRAADNSPLSGAGIALDIGGQRVIATAHVAGDAHAHGDVRGAHGDAPSARTGGAAGEAKAVAQAGANSNAAASARSVTGTTGAINITRITRATDTTSATGTLSANDADDATSKANRGARDSPDSGTTASPVPVSGPGPAADVYEATLTADLKPGHLPITATVTVDGTRSVLSGALDLPDTSAAGAAALPNRGWGRTALWSAVALLALLAGALWRALRARQNKRRKAANQQACNGSAA